MIHEVYAFCKSSVAQKCCNFYNIKYVDADFGDMMRFFILPSREFFDIINETFPAPVVELVDTLP